jgi:membrane protein
MILPGRDLSWRDFARQLYHAWRDDALADTAAALTYYGMLSLFPFLLFVAALAGLLLDPAAIRGLLGELAKFVPPQVTQIVEGRLQSLQRSASGGLLTFGFIATLWAASSGMSSLGQALSRCYEVRETRPYWRTRGLAVLVTLISGAAGVLIAAITFFLPLVGVWLGGPLGASLIQLRFVAAGILLVVLWAFLYWVLPNVRPRFQLITPGSIIGALGWLAASWGFSEYVRHSRRYDAIYGALGGVIVLLVWMWITALVVLVGAEINKILTPAAKLRREALTGEQALGGGPEPRVVAKPREPEPSPT